MQCKRRAANHYNFKSPSLSLFISFSSQHRGRKKTNFSFLLYASIITQSQSPPPPPPLITMHPQPPPPYPNQYYGGPPPVYHGRNASRYPPPYRKRSSCARGCCRCICCCCCFLFLLVLVQILVSLALALIYDPKIPNYMVDNLEVKALDLLPDSTLNTEFLLSIRADNPNKKIGFIYGDRGWVVLTYRGVDLSTGRIPSFYQGYENTTVMSIDLKGKSDFGPELQQTFADNVKSHRIPLLVKLRVPVSIVVGEMHMREFRVLVNCSLVIDNLAPNTKVGILSKTTTFSLEF